jgi:hypothetical protein
MRKYRKHISTGSVLAVLAVLIVSSPVSFATGGRDWHFSGTGIEACSCPMFCSCYFNTDPALKHTAHGPEHFCKFNMACKINKGHFSGTDLAGVKFWVAADLGACWKSGDTEWAVVTFQPGRTEAQKNGVTTILSHMFPVKWKSFEVADDATIEWQAPAERAEARLAGGAKAQIILNKWQGMGGRAGVLENIAYFAVPRNDGFKMMPNEIETYKAGNKAFGFKGTTGFMVTVDMPSSDLAV